MYELKTFFVKRYASASYSEHGEGDNLQNSNEKRHCKPLFNETYFYFVIHYLILGYIKAKCLHLIC